MARPWGWSSPASKMEDDKLRAARARGGRAARNVKHGVKSVGLPCVVRASSPTTGLVVLFRGEVFFKGFVSRRRPRCIPSSAQQRPRSEVVGASKRHA